jgi:hypothetical protein
MDLKKKYQFKKTWVNPNQLVNLMIKIMRPIWNLILNPLDLKDELCDSG